MGLCFEFQIQVVKRLVMEGVQDKVMWRGFSVKLSQLMDQTIMKGAWGIGNKRLKDYLVRFCARDTGKVQLLYCSSHFNLQSA